MANIWEKAISILGGNLNSGRSYHITTVPILFLPSYSYLGLILGDCSKSAVVLSRVYIDASIAWQTGNLLPREYFLTRKCSKMGWKQIWSRILIFIHTVKT